jgi:hypothetical protein
VLIAPDLPADDALPISRELGPGHEPQPEAVVVSYAGSANQNQISCPAFEQLELN